MILDYTAIAEDLAKHGLSLVDTKDQGLGVYSLLVQDRNVRPFPIGFTVDDILDAILQEAGSDEAVHELIRAAARRKQEGA